MSERNVRIYPFYERFWHWTQMALIFILLFTGLGLNGIHALIPFKPAVMLHVAAALLLIGLWLLTIFWMFVTGTWRHFTPRLEGMWQVARFYAWGVFRGEEHPYHKHLWRKHNPLQAITYLALKLVIFPAIWITGLAYLTYNFWEEVPNAGFVLMIVANLHLLTAYVIAAFVILHVYLLTVGEGFRHHVKPMVTGFDRVELTEAQEAYLAENEPWRLEDRA